MRRLLLACALWLPFAVAAAPKQADIDAYRALVAQDLRLATIGYRLASANTLFCRDQDFNPGWVIHDIAQYPEKDVARAAFGFEQLVEIAAVVPGSPADKEGIEAGDGFVSVHGTQVERIAIDGKSSYDRVASVKALASRSWRSRARSTIEMQMQTGPVALHFYPDAICASDFQVDVKDKVDAGADGKMVSISLGLMRFAADEDELAAAVAHELAHNLLRHRERLDELKKQKKRNKKAVRTTEEEADRLSVWLMSNAGYDPAKALTFWERYGRKYGLGIFEDGSHHRWKKRVEMMRAEIALMGSTERRDGLLPPPLLVAVQ